MRKGGAPDVFGGGVFAVNAGREFEAEFAEQVLDEGGAIHGRLAGHEVGTRAQFLSAQGEQRSEEFAHGILGAGGDVFQAFAQERGDVLVVQPEIEDGQIRVEFFVVVFGDAIFLHAELDVFVVDLQVGFDDPMMAIGAGALKDEGVGPNAPLFAGVEMAFGAADGFVDEGQSAGQANAAGAGMEFQEFLIGNVRDADGFVLGSGRGHGMDDGSIGEFRPNSKVQSPKRGMADRLACNQNRGYFRNMSKAEILEELPKLSPSERSQLFARLAELHEADLVGGAEPTDAERQLLDEAFEQFIRDSDPGQPWREVLNEIRSRRA